MYYVLHVIFVIRLMKKLFFYLAVYVPIFILWNSQFRLFYSWGRISWIYLLLGVGNDLFIINRRFSMIYQKKKKGFLHGELHIPPQNPPPSFGTFVLLGIHNLVTDIVNGRQTGEKNCRCSFSFSRFV